jgi:hypothetical protein
MDANPCLTSNQKIGNEPAVLDRFQFEGLRKRSLRTDRLNTQAIPCYSERDVVASLIDRETCLWKPEKEKAGS